MIERVLAIETSCDDTSVAVVRHDGFVEGIVSANQDLVHKVFGGIVPEIASRNHNEHLLPLIEALLQKYKLNWADIGGVAVTSRPGLVGSLLVGVMTAKTLAWSKNLPLIGVNHLEAHLLAPFLRDETTAPPKEFDYPYVALAVSGGHTQLYNVAGLGKYTVLGKTVDDAAGEAFDKFAKMLGLEFPGGPKVDALAKKGIANVDFPRGKVKDNPLNFSFSGLKAAGARYLEKLSKEEIQTEMANLCASYQQAIVDVLLEKLNLACEEQGANRAVLTGGVSANSGLRQQAQAWADSKGIELVVPPLRYCTDNAAMVGYAGILRLNRGESSDQGLKPLAESLADDFTRIS